MKTMKRNVLSVLLALLLALTMLPLGVFAQSRERVDKPPVPIKAATKESKTQEKEAKKTLLDPFIIQAKDATALYKMVNGKFMVSPILNTEENYNLFFATIGTLKDNDDVKKLTWDHDEASKSNEGSFFLVLKNGKRVIFSLNKNNRIQAGEEYYQIPEEAYKALKTIYDTEYTAPQFAQWLIHMLPSKVTGVSVYNSGSFMAIDKDNMSKAVQSIRGIRVLSGEQHYPARVDLHREANAFSFKLLFGDETDSPDYTLVVNGDTLYIMSSELRFNTEYTLPAGEAQRIKTLLNSFAVGETQLTPQTLPAQTPGSELLVTPAA